MKKKLWFTIIVVVIAAQVLAACASPAPAPTAEPAAAAAVPATEAPATKAPEPTTAPAPTTTPLPPAEKTLRFVWIGDLTPLWHPAQWETFGQVVIFSLIFNNLVDLDEDLKTIVPDLAEKFEVSPDATTFTFTLRKDVKWHDGTPFTAKDVVFSFSRQILNPHKVSSHMLNLIGADDYKTGKADKVSGIEQLDDYTIRLTLVAPDLTFLFNMREPGNVIVPEHLLKDVKPDEIPTAPFTLNSPVGTGPYKFVQYVTDQYVEMTANADYFKGKPKIDKIFMKRMSADTAIAQLESGEVDLALRISPLEYERISKIPTLNAISQLGMGHTSLNFPTEISRMSDKRVRQAIAYAIDKKALVQAVFQGRANVLNGAPPALDGFKDLDPYELDLEKGKQLLTEAGFDLKAPFRMIYDRGYPASGQYMPIIAQQISKLGLSVELIGLDATAFIARSQKQRDSYEIYVGQGGNQRLGPWITNIYFNCERPGYNTGYLNCDLDKAFKNARSTSDPAQVEAAYNEVARILNENLAQISLWTPFDLHASSKKLGGSFSVHGDPRSSFTKIETWEIQ